VQIADQQKVLAAFKKEHANTKIGEIKVGQVLTGMHGMLAMVYQTSKLSNTLGINYRGHDLESVFKNSIKAPGGKEPLPEAALWLLLTGQFPTESEVKEL
jgi:citrate synthase